MAYLAKIETQDSRPVALPAIAAIAANSNERPNFSPLEWSIIRLARIDRLWTIRTAGRLRRFWNWFVGRGNPELANPKLEALRRMAVLTWHFGFTVPGEDVSEFISAGFSPDQYELMAGSINAALSSPRRIPA
jgi:hypothetical protein